MKTEQLNDRVQYIAEPKILNIKEIIGIMEYKYEIFWALQEYYKKDIESLLYTLKELYEITHEQLFQNEIERICNEYGYCPHCFSDNIETVKVGYDSYEAWGHQFYVPVNTLKCASCGYLFY